MGRQFKAAKNRYDMNKEVHALLFLGHLSPHYLEILIKSTYMA